MKSKRKTATPALVLLVMLTVGMFHSPAEGGSTVTRIKSKGKLNCGVSDGVPGFSQKDAAGRWTGMDVDFCRALAAAVLGDPEKVEFVPLSASARFPSLKAGEIDVLVRNTTWTLEREATLELMFGGVLVYDGQGFLVPARSGVRELPQLNGAVICVVKGSNHEGNLSEYFRGREWSYQPLLVENQGKAAEALFSGQCQAFTSERPQLTGVKQKAPGGPEEYQILPEIISKEPMGPVVRRGDEEWFTLVRWVLFTLIRAEETGFTQSNVRSRLDAATEPGVKRMLDLDTIISKSFGVSPGWASRALESVGNYGEMFERNLGSQSGLKLERGLNRLWNQGGLMYAPPLH